MAFIFAILMWGVVYQGYNAVFPAFYQELFPTKTRVTAFAVSQTRPPDHRVPAGDLRRTSRPPGACLENEDLRHNASCPSGEPAGWRATRSRQRGVGRRQLHPRPCHYRGLLRMLRSRDVPDPPQRSRQQERPSRSRGRSTTGSARPASTCPESRSDPDPHDHDVGRPALRRPPTSSASRGVGRNGTCLRSPVSAGRTSTC